MAAARVALPPLLAVLLLLPLLGASVALARKEDGGEEEVPPSVRELLLGAGAADGGDVCEPRDRAAMMACLDDAMGTLADEPSRNGMMGVWRAKPSSDPNADFNYQQPDQAYGIALLYPKPGVDATTYTGSNASIAEWHVRANDVVLLLGCTPPDSRYFSVTPYLMTGAPPFFWSSAGTRLNAAIGDSLSAGQSDDGFAYARINTTGAPDDPRASWSAETAVLFAADRRAADTVRGALVACGVPARAINVAGIPRGLATHVGAGRGKFALYLRSAEPANATAYAAYLDDAPDQWLVASFAVRADGDAPFDNVELRSTSQGAVRSEARLRGAVDALARSVEGLLGGGARRYDRAQAPPARDGGECIARGVNCGLGNRDAVYGQVQPFVRLRTPEAVALAVGVTHGAAAPGTATYSNIAANDVRRRLGLVVLDDGALAQSGRDVAVPMLADTAWASDAPALYVAAFARSCVAATAQLPPPLNQAACAEIPAAGFPSAPDPGAVLSLWERTYADRATLVGPDVAALVLPQLVVRGAEAVDERTVRWG